MLTLMHLDRLEELRSGKQKLTRLLKEKDDELEKSNTKVESLRQDIKRADALRKEVRLEWLFCVYLPEVIND